MGSQNILITCIKKVPRDWCVPWLKLLVTGDMTQLAGNPQKSESAGLKTGKKLGINHQNRYNFFFNPEDYTAYIA